MSEGAGFGSVTEQHRVTEQRGVIEQHSVIENSVIEKRGVTEQDRREGQSSGTAIPTQRQGSAGSAFPVARVFDRVKPDGSPLISRPNLDPREIPALVAYLTRSAVALSAPGATRDELVSNAPASVPRAFHTDGAWVWPAA